MDNGEAKLHEIHDHEGNLTRIEVMDEAGDFVLDIVWDERDEQTPTNKEAFRKWAYQVVKRYGYTHNN